LTPERRRRAVGRLQTRFGVSERRACRVAGQHRSTQRKPPPAPRPADERLATRLREIAGEHPRWGWKTAHQILLREGWTLKPQADTPHLAPGGPAAPGESKEASAATRRAETASAGLESERGVGCRLSVR
jgi:hypothetical protein